MKLILFLGFCAFVNGGVIQSGADIFKRIVGGKETSIRNYPWQLSLQRGPSSWSHTCGASIISENWAVTAAHCVDESSPSEMRVVAGTSKLSEGGEDIVLEEIIMHPDYDGRGEGFPNDIAVLKLSKSLTFNDECSPIVMADDDSDDFAGFECDLSGWGRLGGSQPLPDNLQMVTMRVHSNTDCKDQWKSVSDAAINAGHICIGGTPPDTDKSSCNGDSGGPMTCEVGGKKVLAGATSWGIVGCTGNYPSVYTRISHFRGWIREKTGI